MSDVPVTDDARVTRVVFLTVRPGQERAFESLARATNAKLTKRPGVSGVDVVAPPPGQQLYAIIVRFESVERLREWDASDDLRELVAALATVADASGSAREHGGMEGWIAVPGRAPPPRWKSVCVSFLAAYPTIAFLQIVVMTPLTFLPDVVRGVLMGLLMCIALTYVLMPLLTRLLAGWLYPSEGSA